MTDLHIHDYGDADMATIRAGKADCVDPECPDLTAGRGVYDRVRRNMLGWFPDEHEAQKFKVDYLKVNQGVNPNDIVIAPAEKPF